MAFWKLLSGTALHLADKPFKLTWRLPGMLRTREQYISMQGEGFLISLGTLEWHMMILGFYSIL